MSNSAEQNKKNRKTAEKYIEGKKGQKLLINTSIANTTYIKNVIKSYVKGDEQVKEQLYHEPAHNYKELAILQKMFGVDAKQLEDLQKKLDKDIHESMQIKKDQTNIKLPKSKILK